VNRLGLVEADYRRLRQRRFFHRVLGACADGTDRADCGFYLQLWLQSIRLELLELPGSPQVLVAFHVMPGRSRIPITLADGPGAQC
jgi:hypothetical protein